MKNFSVLKNLVVISGLFLIIFTGGTYAQVAVTVTNPTNTTPNLSASYASLASAVTALSGITAISGPVTLTAAAGSETAPAGGYVINFTAATSATNYVVITGTATTTITAPNPQTSGNLNDAIFKIIGSDFVTIQNFTMQENASNTTTTAASNNMTEWGVAVLYASTTNGCQNVTIQNNTISLNRTYQNTFGIYANATHSATTVTSSSTATGTTGGNHNLKIYSNSISNVNMGILVVGPTAAADHNNTVEIGGTAGTGNTITNFGTTGTFSGYANVSGTVNGILVRNSINFTIGYNTITSSVGGTTSGTLNGIQIPASSNAPTATFTNNIINNSISLQSAAASGAINGINYPSGSASTTSSLNVNANNFSSFGHTVTGSGTITFITIASTNQFTSISNNTFTNISVNTTGSVTFISQSFTAPSNGTKTTNNNSIVTGFTKTGAGGTVTLITDNGSTVSGALSYCQNNTFSNGTLTGVTALTGISFTDGGTAPTRTVSGNVLTNWTTGAATVNMMNFTYWNGASTLSNNTITNINGQGAITGITIGSSANSANPGIISNNIINNLISSGTGGNVTGITCSNTSPQININNNSINTLSSTGAAVVSGIVVSGATLTNVFKNKIYDLAASNASGTVNGILVSGGTTVNVYNNYAGDLRTPAANAANPLIGLSITGGTTINAYYNTVYLNGTSSGALFGSSAVSVSTSPTVTLRNNIFVNTSANAGATGFTVAYRRSSTTLTTYGSNSNNNDFYAGTPGTNNLIYYDGASSVQTLAAYKVFAALSPRDAGTVSENPNWVSTTGSLATFLHINTGIATQLEGGATSISGYTDDYDGDARNASTPDIGADEFAGIALDLTPPVISYTALPNTSGSGNRTLTATITDGTGVPTSGIGLPVLYWNINSGSWSSVTGVSIGSNQFTFTFGSGVVLGDIVNYYIAAQDACTPPNVGTSPSTGASGLTSDPPAASTAPTSPATYTIIGSLCGVKTIGASGYDYPTITAAVADLSAKEVTCALTFNLMDASYSASETFPIVINSYLGASATNTVTFKPNTTSVITGSVSSGAIIKLNGADYVTFDGSNSGGTDRSLTIENTTTTTSGNAVIWIASAASGNGANYNTVKNCIIQGNAATTTFLGMYIGGTGTISLTAAGSELNNNNTVSNNLFRKTQYGLALYGYAAASPDLNNSITNNNFGTAVTGEGFGLIGINADRQTNLVVSGNEIQNIVHSSTSSNMIGIRLLDFKNGLCFNNKIHDILYSGSSTAKVYGIAVTSSSYTTAGNPSQCQVYNNTVYKLNSSGTSTVWNVTGILASAGYGDKYYFNSVNLTGQLANSSSGLCAAFANGDGNISTVGTNIDVRNNIFSLTGSSITSGGNFWAYYSGATSVSGSTLNFNNLYCNGTNATNNIGRFNSLSYTTLAAWQTATGMEANSIITDPSFNGPSALQLQSGSPAFAAGTPIAGITTDITGTSRSVTNPSMGAYELTGDFVPPTISYTTLSNTLCTSDRSLSVTITDNSGVNTTTGTKPRLYFKKSTDNNTYSGNTSADNGWKYVEASNAASPFNFATDYSLLQSAVAAGDIIQYFITAQDLSTSVLVGINNGTFNSTPVSVNLTAAAFPITGTINQFTILSGALSSDVTIGASGTYTSLTGAGGLFATLNAGGLSANITATLMDATITETGANALNQMNYGCAGNYTLTIKPQTTTTLTGSVASGALIKLNGADYVIIDGSNSGGTDRNLTITNSATTAPSVIAIISQGTGLGATNNTIKNCNLSTGTATSIGYGISVGGATPGTSGADNDNVTIQNNAITLAPIGIYANGTTSVTNGGDDNLTIAGNSVDYNGTLVSIGIQVGNSLNSLVTQNTVTEQTSVSQAPTGISIETGFVSSVVSRNLVSKSVTTNTGGYGGRGITIGTGTTTSNLTICNNIVYGVNGSDYSGFSNSSSMGIALGMVGNSSTITTTTGGINLYHNTVRMTGTIGSNSTTAITTALYIGSGCSNLDIRNNILANTMTGSSTTQKNYAIYSAAAIGAFTTINYNDYYVANSFNAASAIPGYLSSDRTDLAGIITGFGQNANSLVVDPQLISTTDMRVQLGSPVLAAGTPVPAVTNDYAGTVRSLTTPSIGAYENGVDLAGPVFTYTALSNTTSLLDRTLTVTITDPSGVPTSGSGLPMLYWKIDAGAYTGVQGVSIGSDQYTFTFGAGVVLGNVVSYYIVAQDNVGTPNVSVSPSAGASGLTANPPAASTPPTTPNTYTIVLPMAGTFNIPSGTYKSLTDNASGQAGSPGIFQAINNAALSGDITIIIDGDLIETGTNALNQFSEEGVGNYHIYINSDGTSRTISQTAGGITNPMISLNGADRVTIDGGAGKNLTFRNTHATPATAKAAIQFINGATSDILTNCTIESNATTTTQGAVLISTGTNNVTISSNTIHEATAGTTGSPATGIYSGSSSNTLTITGNSIYNFTGTGISLASAADGCSVSGNSLFNTLTPSTAQTGISLGGGNNHSVTGNFIGGQSANCGGSPWVNSGAVTFTGIYSTGSSTTANTISGNTIQNISLSNTGSAPFIGINLNGGKASVLNNLIGHESSASSITIAGTATVIGINSVNADLTTLTGNTLANISQTTSGSAGYFDGIWLAGNANKTISLNKIYKCGPTSASTGSSYTDGIYIPGTSGGTMTYTIYNNMISLGHGISNNHVYAGIDDNGYSGNNIICYFNSVSIGGTCTSSSVSYAFLKRDATNETLMNNVFQNDRSGGTGKHYAIGYTTTTGTNISNYNNLIATGATGGNTGIFSSTVCSSLAAWRTASSKDANSISAVTTFTDIPNGDLHASATMDCHLDGTGTDISGYTTDFDAQTRNNPPDIGADEFTGTIPPVAVSGGNQQICFGTATPDLSATGTGTLKWYSDPALTTLVYTGTPFATGKTLAGVYNYYVTNNFGNCASAPVTVTLTIDATTVGGSVGTSHGVCYGTDGGTLTLTGHTGSVVRWEYSTDAGQNWSPIVNTTTSHAVGILTQETMFRAVVQNGLCLETPSDPATLTINALPVATASSDSPRCDGYDLNLFALPNSMNTYAWSGPNGFSSAVQNPSISSAQLVSAGIYSLTVTDANSCQGTAQTTVVINELPTGYTVGGSGTYCNGVNGKSVTLSNSETGVTYELIKNSMATGLTIPGNNGLLTWNNCLAGNYFILATNNTTHCQQVMSGNASITEDPAISALISPDPAYNQINTGLTLHGNPVGGTGVYSTHTWTGATSYLNASGVESPVFTGTSTGNFNLTYTVTDDHGCIATDNITVAVSNPPANPVMPGQVRCGTGTLLMTATVGVGGDAVQFSLNGSDVALTDNSSPFEYTTPSVTQGTTTTIYARSINTTTGFVSSWITAGAQADLPTVAGAASPVAATVCNNASTTINLTGQTGTVLYWEQNFNGGSWTSIGNAGLTTINTGTLTPAGTYGFHAVVRNGVCSVLNSANASVLVNQVVANAVVTNVSCFNGTNGAINMTESGGTAPYTYLWSNNAATQDISGLSAGSFTVTVTDALSCTATNSWTVTEPPLLTVSAVPTMVSCYGGSNGTLNTTPAGGVSPYTFVWSNSSILEDISGLLAGTYSVTVTDHQNCQTTGNWTITQPSAPISSTATTQAVSCFNGNNGSIDLTPAGGTPSYTYLWSNGAVSQDLTNLIAGTYFVTITDSKGCSHISDYTITQPPALTLNGYVGNVTIPGGWNGYINLTPGGGTPPYTYHWSNNSANQNLTGLHSGIYYVTLTDVNNCTKTASYLVTEPNQININSIITDAQCYGGSDGAIDISVSGGTSPYSYAWSTGSSNEDITNLSPGIYSLTITDFNGALKQTSFIVSSPPALSGSVIITNNLCYSNQQGAINLTMSGGVTPYSYLWSTGHNTQDISGLPAGIYTVTVTDDNACTFIHFWYVNQPSGPITINPTIQNVSCMGGNNGSISLSTLFGTSPYSYQWSNGNTTATVSNLSAGNYSVTVTDANLCTQTASWTITQPNLLTVSTSATDAYCNGNASGTMSAVASGGTAPYTFTWSNGLTGSYQSGVPAGTYTVTVTDIKGCTAVNTAVINQPTAIVVEIASTQVSCFGGNNGTALVSATGGTGAYTYQWSTGSFNASITGLTQGTYSVTVKDANLCPKTKTVVISQPPALNVSANLTHVLCNSGQTGAIVLTPSGGVTPYLYSWSNGAQTKDISGLAAGSYSVTITDANSCVKTATYTIQENSLIVAPASIQPVSCYNGSNGSINITPGGGSGSYTYLWSNGAVTQDISDLTAGIYAVTITDQHQCSKIFSWTITQPDPFVSNETITTVSCFNGSNGAIVLNPAGGTAPFGYLWSNGGIGNEQSNLTAGMYTVTVTDANSCVTITGFTVSQPAAPVSLSAIPTAVACYGGSTGSIDLSVSGGTAPYTYLWTNSGVSQDITNLASGNYTVTVTDAHLCTAVQSWQVSQPASALNATAELTHINCFGGQTGAINLMVSGGTSPYSFLWSNTSISEDLSGLTAGTYTVTVTDFNQCTAIQTFTLTQPSNALSATASPTAVSCFGGSNGSIQLTVSGGTSSYTYLWSNNAVTQNISGLLAGTYTVTITDSRGCQFVLPSTVSQPAAPLALNASSVNISCFGDNTGSIVLTATGGTPQYSYLWSTGAVTKDLNNLIAGTYAVTVTDVKGCTSTASWTLTQPAAALNATASLTGVPCYNGTGGAINLSPTGGTPSYSFLWSNGAIAEDLSGLAANTYTVTVTDSKNCKKIASFTVTQPLAALSVTASLTQVLCNGASTGAIVQTPAGGTSPYTYLWSDGATGKDRSAIPAGVYAVTITDAQLCTKTASYTITQPTAVSATGVVTHVSCSGLSNGAINLTTSGGTTPYTWLWNDNALMEDRSGLAPGTYSVTVTDLNNCTAIRSFTISNANITPVITQSAPGQQICSGSLSNEISFSSNVVGTTYTWTTAPNALLNGYLVSGTGNIPQQTINNAGLTDQTLVYTVYPMANGCQGLPLQHNLQVYTVPTGSISGTTTICTGSSTQLSFNLTGNGPWNIVYNNGVSNIAIPNVPVSPFVINVQPAATTTYTLINVRDSHFCFGNVLQSTATVSVQAKPTASLSGSTSICYGESANLSFNLTGTPPWNLTWSDGSPHQVNGIMTSPYVLNVMPAATISISTLALSDAYCSAVSLGSPATIQVKPLPTATLSGSQSVCPGNPATLQVAFTGVAPWSVTYSDGNTIVTQDNITSPLWTFQVNPVSNTTYSLLTVEDANCTGTVSGSAQIILYDRPTAVLQGPSTVCAGAGVALSVSFTGTAPWSFTWFNGSSHVVSGITANPYTFNVNPTATTTYAITSVTDAFCSGNNFGLPLLVTVKPLPTAKITNSQSVCAGASAVLTVQLTGTPPWSITVDNGTSTVISGITTSVFTYTVSPSITTTYTLVNVSDATCQGTIIGSPATVTIYPVPVLNTAQINQSYTLCSGTSMSFTAHFTSGTPPFSLTYRNYLNQTVTVPNLNEGSVVNFIPPAAEGDYTYTLLSITDANGCTGSVNYPFVLLVFPEPVAVAGPDLTVSLGNSVTFNGMALGGTAPYQYLWNPPVYLNNPGIANPECTPLNSTEYTFTVIDFNGCIASDVMNLTVTNALASVYGNLTYANTLSTPLSPVKIYVRNTQNQAVDSTITNASGFYSFANLPAGNYHLDPVCFKETGGINSTDAMLVITHFAQIQLLSGLYLKAADVDGNHFVNSLDALLIARYFVDSISALPAGSWVFEPVSFTIPTPVSEFNFSGLCYGDVNGSFQPGLKPEPAVLLNMKGSIESSAEGIIQLPVYADQTIHTQAVSLILEYPESDLQILDVRLTSNDQQVLYHAADGLLRISWYGIDPLDVSPGEVLFTLVAKSNISLTEPFLSCAGNSEFANLHQGIEQKVLLSYPAVEKTSGPLTVQALYPVPANEFVDLEILVNAPGKIRVDIHSLTGEIIRSSEVTGLEGELNTFRLDVSALPCGTYFMSFWQENADNENLSSHHKLIITR